MNSGCIDCIDIAAVAVLRGDGYAAFFYCPKRRRRITHLMPGESLPCRTHRDDGGPTINSGGDVPLPVAAIEVVS